jgi:hypothetical protein
VPLRQDLIDLTNDFTRMREPLLDLPQEFGVRLLNYLSFVDWHFCASEADQFLAPPRHRNSKLEEVIASTKRL